MAEATVPPLLELRGLRKSFPRPDGGTLEVLRDVEFTLQRGEIVGVLGRSGSGKSTLLRIIAGLLPASAGEAHYQGAPITAPPEGVAMVFQSFGLFPWLTVLGNVQLGLEALGVPEEEQQKRAVDAIDLIGLDGFEQAYPRELSGGMQQRVGLARALVVHPNILLMDEPFSSLDVLTAETLRNDLLALWVEGQLPIESIIMVTHSIEEAVIMSDRVIVFGSNPGRIVADVEIPLERPRERDSKEFMLLVDHLYGQLTDADEIRLPPAERLPQTAPLQHVGPGLINGLVDLLASKEYRGHADLPVLAQELQMGIAELFPVAETLHDLGLAILGDGDLKLTDDGAAYAATSGDARKGLFATQITSRVGLIDHIMSGIRGSPGERLPVERVEGFLADVLEESAAEETLAAAVNWGRYAELFSYDDRQRYLTFEDL